MSDDRPPTEVLISIYQDHSEWARHFADQSTKVNTISLVLVSAVMALYGKSSDEIYAIMLIVIGTVAFFANIVYWNRSAYVWRIAVKARGRMDGYDFVNRRVFGSAKRHFTIYKIFPVLPNWFAGIFWTFLNLAVIFLGIYLL